jgi:hypothetical protein
MIHRLKKLKKINMLRGGVVAVFAIVALTILGFRMHESHEVSAQTAEYPNLKVAFIGDDGNGQNHKSNLTMIKSEGSSFIVDGGDLDYKNNPTLWDDLFTSVMGSSYPYFVAEGNHDIAQWPGYQQKLAARYGKVSGETCTGTIGQMQACHYKGVLMLLMAPGMEGAPPTAEQTTFIKQQLAASTEKWKICVWHYPLYQLNSGPAGDAPFEACKDGGAIIATAHSHYYVRSRTMSDVPSRTIDPACNFPKLVCVALGKTFTFISGLGGVGTQAYTCPPDATGTCQGWQVVNSADNGSTYGALYIIFNYLGNSNRAYAYYKDISGRIIDTFDIVLNDQPEIPPAVTDLVPGRVYKFAHVTSNKVLTAAGTAKQSAVTISTDTDAATQKWVYKSDGFYLFNTNMALDVSNAGVANNTNVWIWNGTNDRAQHWQPSRNSDGTYTLINPNSDKALDVYRNGTANGTDVNIYTQNGLDSQKWKAVVVGSMSLSFDRPSEASSVWATAGNEPSKAFDGDLATRWNGQSGFTTNQWLSVDLGANTKYDEVIIKESSYARVTSYKLQSSNDGVTYTDIPGTEGTTIGANKIINFADVTSRYVRLYINTASAVPTINEMEVYDTSSPTPTEASTATPTPTLIPTATPMPTVTSIPTPTGFPTVTSIPTPTKIPTAVPTSPGITSIFYSMADANVRSDLSTRNYGSSTTLYVDTGSPISISYVKFDLTSLAGKTIKDAYLEIRTGTDASLGSQNVKATNSSWGEKSITYQNRPALGTILGVIKSGNKKTTWQKVSVTSYIQQNVGNSVSFGIDTSSTDGIYLDSRETSNDPKLVIVWQ